MFDQKKILEDIKVYREYRKKRKPLVLQLVKINNKLKNIKKEHITLDLIAKKHGCTRSYVDFLNKKHFKK